MKVKDLKKIIEEVDENLEVFINQANDEYDNSYVEIAQPKNITFYDGENKICEETCFIITDEI